MFKVKIILCAISDVCQSFISGRDEELRDVGIKRKKKQRETKPKTWEFQEELIFKRYDSFVDRLIIVREFFQTSDQFLKLEKVEMGGIRGKNLSSRIFHIFEEFKEQFTVFRYLQKPCTI